MPYNTSMRTDGGVLCCMLGASNKISGHVPILVQCSEPSVWSISTYCFCEIWVLVVCRRDITYLLHIQHCHWFVTIVQFLDFHLMQPNSHHFRMNVVVWLVLFRQHLSRLAFRRRHISKSSINHTGIHSRFFFLSHLINNGQIVYFKIPRFVAAYGGNALVPMWNDELRQMRLF